MAAIPTFWKIGALVPALLVAGIGSWHARADPQELPRLTLAHGPSPAGPRAGVPRLPTRPLSLAPPPSAVRLLRRAAPPSARATNPSGGAVTTAAASSASEEIAAHEDLVRREVDERLRRGREGEKRGDIAEALTEFQWAREMISWSFHEDTSMAGPLATAEAGFERNRAAMGVIDEFLRTAGELFAGGSYDQVEERCREFLATHPRYEIITRCGELARAAGQA
ncbi:MAG: hypothetical protein HZA54_10555, partial [Planctomycetes bacterium]|nr:hypothetical protein [Planctomycetota bacterium]